mmetsp:Transcript_68329/g.192689  ORF Transcript_68329/g.192689 Transcript_68329/m.192689 type:complete len:200 (+) Transcript_68329:84-683(+)
MLVLPGFWHRASRLPPASCAAQPPWPPGFTPARPREPRCWPTAAPSVHSHSSRHVLPDEARVGGTGARRAGLPAGGRRVIPADAEEQPDDVGLHHPEPADLALLLRGHAEQAHAGSTQLSVVLHCAPQASVAEPLVVVPHRRQVKPHVVGVAAEHPASSPAAPAACGPREHGQLGHRGLHVGGSAALNVWSRSWNMCCC